MIPAITHCRACKSSELTEFLDLGEQYLSDFRKDVQKPPKYPLVAVFCEDCKLVQLKHTTPQVEMYHDRYGFKSGISDSIKADHKDIVKTGLKHNPFPESWLDIACNDGTLLSFVPKEVYRCGVDPVTFLCEEAKQHSNRVVNDFFDAKHFETETGLEKFDVVTSISCFYDMPDPNKFVADVKDVLADTGIWIIQQNYLLTTLELSAVDNFCHEHLEYYTLLSLENLLDEFDLEVNDVSVSMVNGGSIRTVVSHRGMYPVKKSVQKQRDKEAEASLETVEPYSDFAACVNNEIVALRKFAEQAKAAEKSVCILAASTRGATIWQAAGLGPDLISYAVERNPAKVGRNFSAIGVPIISEEEFRTLTPDFAIIGPWFFAKEIIKRERAYTKAGGKLVLPLPKVEII